MTGMISLLLSFVFGLGAQAYAQNAPPNLPTKEQLANDNNLFIAFAKKALHWEEPTEPVRIVGPIYFVGTKGLGAFLITTLRGTHPDEHRHALVRADDRRLHSQTRFQT